MNGKIGIGVISFVHGHAGVYCKRLLEDDDVRLAACWDDDQSRGEKAAEQYGMTYSPHLEDVLQNPDIQGVIVTCETNRHTEMVIAAAEAGKAILCQKPMALSLADCDRIIDVVARTGVFFMMAHQMRHDPANIKMKELVASGVLGKVAVFRRRHCINVLFNESFVQGPTRWHLDPAKNMGMWMDDASHATDLIHWIMGYPTSVIAEIDNILTNVAPDDTGMAVYRFPDGAMATLLNSSVTLAGENTTEIYGDQGVVIQNYGDAPSCAVPLPPGAIAVKLYTRNEPRWRDLGIPIPKSQGERIAAVPRPFVDALKYDLPSSITARDGRVAVEMVLGAYRAAHEGRRVTFPLA